MEGTEKRNTFEYSKMQSALPPNNNFAQVIHTKRGINRRKQHFFNIKVLSSCIVIISDCYGERYDYSHKVGT